MQILLFFLRLLGRTLAAVVSTVQDRAARGPADPAWGWGLELMMGAARPALTAIGTAPPATQKTLNDRARGEVPKAWSALVERRDTTLGGRRADEFLPRGAALRGHDEPAGSVLYFHGGGYAIGSLETYRAYAARLVLATGARVILPEYRLSTEAPYPAALDDCAAAYEDLLEQGVDPAKLAIGGESAGGGLTLALLLRLRDAGRPQPAAAVAISPWTDLTGTSPTLESNRDTDYLTREAADAWAAQYAGGQDLTQPSISPAFGDYRDVAPLLLQVGAVEILRNDSDLVAEAVTKAGGELRYAVYPHMPHAWALLLQKRPETQMAWHEIGGFLRTKLGAD